jgi:multidrug efflux system outer membrane protein
MKQSLKHAVSLALVSACMGCAVGPDYVKPVVATPAGWHPEAPWQAAQPQDETIRGDWWTLYDDPVLNGLEQKAAGANPTLKAAFEHYTQSEAELGEVKSAEMPSVGPRTDFGKPAAGELRDSQYLNRSERCSGWRSGEL